MAFQRKAKSLAYTQIMERAKPTTSREFLKAIETQTISTSVTGLHKNASAKSCEKGLNEYVQLEVYDTLVGVLGFVLVRSPNFN